jgi:hypothetical protein
MGITFSTRSIVWSLKALEMFTSMVDPSRIYLMRHKGIYNYEVDNNNIFELTCLRLIPPVSFDRNLFHPSRPHSHQLRFRSGPRRTKRGYFLPGIQHKEKGLMRTREISTTVHNKNQDFQPGKALFQKA